MEKMSNHLSDAVMGSMMDANHSEMAVLTEKDARNIGLLDQMQNSVPAGQWFTIPENPRDLNISMFSKAKMDAELAARRLDQPPLMRMLGRIMRVRHLILLLRSPC